MNVLSFTLDSSTQTPHVEQPFDVTVTVRVRQNIPKLDNLFLPDLGSAEEVGDERVLSAGPSGTTYRETLRVIPHASGALDVTPAYLDAVDVRDGKAKRFISNSLHLNVQGPIAPAETGSTLLWIWTGVLGLASALAVMTFIFVRGTRKPQVDVAPPVPTAAPPVPVPQADPYDAAVERLRRERTRAAVMNLRSELWRMAGATDGATLTDVLSMPIAANPFTRSMLTRVERAAFIDDAGLKQAITEIVQ